jgi:cell shape-determining protein MreC
VGGTFLRGTTGGIYAVFFKTRDFVFYPFVSVGSAFKNKNSLQSEIKKLQDENKRLEIENLTVQGLRNENVALKQALNISVSTNNRIALRVLQTPPFSPYDNLLIDINGQNVEVGDMVYYGELAIGRISEKYSKTAIVKLLSAPGEKTPAKIKGEFNIEAEGRGNLSFVASLPKDLNLEKGDIVTLAENNLIVLGYVQEVKTEEAATFQKIYFNFPISFSDLKFVEIRK